MIWTEIRYRRIFPEDSVFGEWQYAPRVPDGPGRVSTPPLPIGARFEAEARRTDDIRNSSTEWRPAGVYDIDYTRPPAEPVRNLRVVCGESLLWDPPDDMEAPGDMRFRVLHAPGQWEHPGDMVPASETWPAAGPFDLCTVPKGKRTLAVVPVDPEGQEGEAAFIITDRGPLDDADLVTGRTDGLTTFDPVTDPVLDRITLVNCSLPGVPAVVRQNPNPAATLGTEAFYIGEGVAPFYRGRGDDDFYVQTYLEAELTMKHYVGSLNGDYDLRDDHGRLTAYVTITDWLNWRLEYRRNVGPFYKGAVDAPFYVGVGASRFRRGLDGSSIFWGDGADEFYEEGGSGPFYKVSGFSPWPGKMGSLGPTRLDLRLVIPASWVQAQVTAFGFRESVPIPVGYAAEQDVAGDLSGVAGAPVVIGLTFGAQSLPLGTSPPVPGQVLTVGDDGDLVPSFGTPAWRTVDVAMASFSDAAMSKRVQVFYVRAGEVIHETVLEVLEAVGGGGSALATLDVGIATAEDDLLAAIDVFTGTAGDLTREATGKLYATDVGTQITATLTSDVALSLLASGRLRFRFLVSSCN